MTPVSEHPLEPGAQPDTAMGDANQPPRPASPKYDERSFFFTTPAPVVRGARTPGPRTTSRSTGRAPGQPHPPGVASPVRVPQTLLGKRAALDTGEIPDGVYVQAAHVPLISMPSSL